jgi:multidrug efflux system membrane fusion protein
MRFREWRRLRSTVRASTRETMPLAVEVRSFPGLMEPAVVGVFRPILLLPAGMRERLTPSEFESIVAHELCHVRRRDNLAAAIHMVVEMLFWFHPLVWWIGARLMGERERACDEEVLALGHEPEIYAGGILKICEAYVQPPLPFVSGITGANLKSRIGAILAAHIPCDLRFSRKAALAAAAVAAVVLPITAGMIGELSARTRGKSASVHAVPLIQSAAGSPGTPTEVAQVTGTQGGRRPQAGIGAGSLGADGRRGPTRASAASEYFSALGNVTPAAAVTVKPRIDGQLLSVFFREGDLVQAGQLLASVDPRQRQIQLRQAEAQYALDSQHSYGSREEREARLKADQAAIDGAKLEMSYTQVVSPITGRAGLRLVDPGNVVYSAAGAPAIVVITQMQPIAVVFQIPEDLLPDVLARLRENSNLRTEAWDRSYRRKLAIGRLVAVDNQIDATTGTAKLKAMFDNQDSALFPNQFVNVRVYTAKP